jgi:hypothetical protein
MKKKYFSLVFPIIFFVFIFSYPSIGFAVEFKNPIGSNNPQDFIGVVIKAILGVVGSFALIMFIYGGFLMLTAAGKAEKWKKGIDVLIWSTIGLVVIFTSYAVLSFVIERLNK